MINIITIKRNKKMKTPKDNIWIKTKLCLIQGTVELDCTAEVEPTASWEQCSAEQELVHNRFFACRRNHPNSWDIRQWGGKEGESWGGGEGGGAGGAWGAAWGTICGAGAVGGAGYEWTRGAGWSLWRGINGWMGRAAVKICHFMCRCKFRQVQTDMTSKATVARQSVHNAATTTQAITFSTELPRLDLL